jgi:membrane protein DedA with SNARE-associated domain
MKTSHQHTKAIAQITIPAGVNRMNVVTFTVISLIGTTIWNFGLILLALTFANVTYSKVNDCDNDDNIHNT